MNPFSYFFWLARCALLLLASTALQAQMIQVDADGVHMLLPSAPGGSALSLGTSDPNTSRQFGFDYHASARPQQEGALKFWTMAGAPLSYSSGNTGITARVHLYASGGAQQFNWRSQQGFLSSPADVNNQEFTVYVRVREPLVDASIQRLALKIRGGKHSDKDKDAASCTMMNLGSGGHNEAASFGKELSHPHYDTIKLAPKLPERLRDNTWIGMKLLSYTSAANKQQVINQLYLDTTAFTPEGKPANHWRLFSEYVDEAGKSTGRYNTLANWGGWQTSLRMDGYGVMDFALLSVREIVPPALSP